MITFCVIGECFNYVLQCIDQNKFTYSLNALKGHSYTSFLRLCVFFLHYFQLSVVFCRIYFGQVRVSEFGESKYTHVGKLVSFNWNFLRF